MYYIRDFVLKLTCLRIVFFFFKQFYGFISNMRINSKENDWKNQFKMSRNCII